MDKFLSALEKFLNDASNKGKYLTLKGVKDTKPLLEAGFEEMDGGVKISYDNAIEFVSALAALKDSGEAENLEMEENMFELEIQEDGTAVLSAENIEAVKGLVADGEKAVETITALEDAKTELEAANEKLAGELEQLKARVVELEKDEDDDEDELPEREVALLERIASLEKESAVAKVDAEIEKAKAYTDANGMGHSAVFLSLVRGLMLLEDVELEDGVIKLEDANDVAKVGAHVRTIARTMLAKVPGQQLKEAKTVGDDTKDVKLEAEDKNKAFEEGKEIGKTFWSEG